MKADVEMDFSALPLYRIPEHDDDFRTGLDGVDEVLGQERWLGILPASVEVAPGLVVPHGGCTGFTCQDIDSPVTSFKMQQGRADFQT